jgi:Spy/CpxP family protein refolding chaperone
MKVVLLTAAMASAALGAGALAEPGKGREGCAPHGFMGHPPEGAMFGERGLNRMASKLNLSAEQRGKIDALMKDAREESSPLRAAMRDNMAAEHKAMASGAGERELKKLAHKSADRRVELMLFGKGVEEKIRAELTDEQRAQLDALKATRQAHRQERMENWRQSADEADDVE